MIAAINTDLTVAGILAVGVGAAIGIFGSGSIITLPVLVYVMHMPVRAAVGISIVVAGATSLGAAIWYYRHGLVHFRAAMMFASVGIPASLAGSVLTHQVPPPVLMFIFSTLLLAAGTAMLIGPKQMQPKAGCRLELCLPAAAAVGITTGFLGVGGGFLIVPVLVFLGGLSTNKAVGTALTVITLNSLAGVAGHLHFAALDWKFTLAFVGLALIGMGLGVSAADHLPRSARRKIFGWGVAIVGIAVACENMLKLL